MRSNPVTPAISRADSTRNQVAASIDVLINDPAQWNLLRDKADLALPAIEGVALAVGLGLLGAFKTTELDVTNAEGPGASGSSQWLWRRECFKCPL